MVWEKALDIIQPSIKEKGFYHYNHSFRKFAKEMKITANLSTPAYLSLDFWSQQRHELIDNNLYVIRFGRGTFVIFSLDTFSSPYLALEKENTQKLKLPSKTNFNHFRKSFRNIDYTLKSAENTLLELARYYDIYSSLVNTFESSPTYQIGSRGGMTQQFDVYMKHKNGNLHKFKYNGQVELDYTIWTEKRVFVIEAKSLNRQGFDIGWHKLSFPSQRFLEQAKKDGLKVNPVYFLRTVDKGKQIILLYVFDELKFHKDGIILNEPDHWNPVKIFQINLAEILR